MKLSIAAASLVGLASAENQVNTMSKMFSQNVHAVHAHVRQLLDNHDGPGGDGDPMAALANPATCKAMFAGLGNPDAGTCLCDSIVPLFSLMGSGEAPDPAKIDCGALKTAVTALKTCALPGAMSEQFQSCEMGAVFGMFENTQCCEGMKGIMGMTDVMEKKFKKLDFEAGAPSQEALGDFCTWLPGVQPTFNKLGQCGAAFEKSAKCAKANRGGQPQGKPQGQPMANPEGSTGGVPNAPPATDANGDQHVDVGDHSDHDHSDHGDHHNMDTHAEHEGSSMDPKAFAMMSKMGNMMCHKENGKFCAIEAHQAFTALETVSDAAENANADTSACSNPLAGFGDDVYTKVCSPCADHFLRSFQSFSGHLPGGEDFGNELKQVGMVKKVLCAKDSAGQFCGKQLKTSLCKFEKLAPEAKNIDWSSAAAGNITDAKALLAFQGVANDNVCNPKFRSCAAIVANKLSESSAGRAALSSDMGKGVKDELKAMQKGCDKMNKKIAKIKKKWSRSLTNIKRTWFCKKENQDALKDSLVKDFIAATGIESAVLTWQTKCAGASGATSRQLLADSTVSYTIEAEVTEDEAKIVDNTLEDGAIATPAVSALVEADPESMEDITKSVSESVFQDDSPASSTAASIILGVLAASVAFLF